MSGVSGIGTNPEMRLGTGADVEVRSSLLLAPIAPFSLALPGVVAAERCALVGVARSIGRGNTVGGSATAVCFAEVLFLNVLSRINAVRAILTPIFFNSSRIWLFLSPRPYKTS